MPATPSIQAGIAFTTEPAATPTWTDVSAYIWEFKTNRGRQYETDQFAAGSATIILDNVDRRFDPSYTGGAYGANVKVGRRLRIQATYSAVVYDLFHGYIEAYDLEIMRSNGGARAHITVADAFKVLSRAVVSGTFAEQKTETRIGAILDAIGWPAGDRTLATGYARTQAVTLTNVSVLSHLQQVVADERGALFISRDGKVIFQDRYHRLRPDTASVMTLGDGGGAEHLYTDVSFVLDDTRIVNDARVTRTGGTEQSSTDSTSQTNYYRRAFSSGGLQATDGYALAVADFMTERYKQPLLHARTLAINPEVNAATLWPLVLARDIGDRLTVRRRPPGGGTIDQLSTLEGVDLAWTAYGGTWTRLNWEVSAGTTDQYWVLGHATYGQLQSTTRLAP
jgi:hypothetical protein